MDRSTIFHGKIHYKWPFSIAMLVHQRVKRGVWQDFVVGHVKNHVNLRKIGLEET